MWTLCRELLCLITVIPLNVSRHSLSLVAVSLCSKAMASSLVTGINHAMARLVDIWDSIGIMEDQRIERMQTVKKYIEVSRDIYSALLILYMYLLNAFLSHEGPFDGHDH